VRFFLGLPPTGCRPIAIGRSMMGPDGPAARHVSRGRTAAVGSGRTALMRARDVSSARRRHASLQPPPGTGSRRIRLAPPLHGSPRPPSPSGLDARFSAFSTAPAGCDRPNGGFPVAVAVAANSTRLPPLRMLATIPRLSLPLSEYSRSQGGLVRRLLRPPASSLMARPSRLPGPRACPSYRRRREFTLSVISWRGFSISGGEEGTLRRIGPCPLQH
jgi:hypothetical protein